MLTSPPESAEHPGGRSATALHHAAAVALIVAATIIAFIPTVNNEFVAWDDDLNLTQNPAFRGLGPEQLHWMFTASHVGHYHPLTWLTFAVDYLIWGGVEPVGFHLTGLFIHALSAIACYVLAVAMLRLAIGRTVSPGWITVGATATALIFAIHPLRVESVAWATERRDVLSGLFYFLAIWAYLRANSRGASRRLRWLVVCFVLFLCALLSKVITVSLPAVLLVLDVFPLRRYRGVEHPERLVLPLFAEKLPFFAAGIGVSLLAIFAQTDVNSMLSLNEYWIPARLVQAPYSLWFYLYKMAVPIGLSPLYELPQALPLTNPRFLWPIVFVPVLTAVLIWRRRRWPALLAAWVAHALMIFPVSGILQNGPQITADRYSYLSCVPYALLVGGGVAMALARARAGAARAAILGGMAVVAVALGSLTWRQVGFWRDSITLWSRVVEIEPHSSFGNNNRGVHLMNAGQYDHAEIHYRRSLETQPKYAKALCNLGVLYARRGDQEAAVKHFRRAISFDGKFAEAHHQLGAALYKLGDFVAARESLETSLRIAPRDPRVYNNLAAAEAALKNTAGAIDVCRRGLERAPNDLNLNRQLAWLLATAIDSRHRNGAEAVRRAEFVNDSTGGNDYHCMLTLGAAYAEVGRFSDAIRLTETAARMAMQAGDRQRAAAMQNCLALYRAGRPYRE